MADAIGGPQMRCTFPLQNLGQQEKQDQSSSFVNIQDSDSNWTWNKNLKSHFFATYSWINMTKQNNGSVLAQNSFFKTLAVVYKHECDCHQSLLKPDWLIITSYFPKNTTIVPTDDKNSPLMLNTILWISSENFSISKVGTNVYHLIFTLLLWLQGRQKQNMQQ